MIPVFARIFVGPLAFAIVQLIPLHGLSPAAHVAISCYAWVLAWWVAMPIPWAATGFLPLAVLYGASAGGMATPAGVPFNPITISLSEQLTGYSVTFAQWTLTGVILTLATIPAYYAVLAWMSPPEVKSIEDGAAYFREQKKTLGPLG